MAKKIIPVAKKAVKAVVTKKAAVKVVAKKAKTVTKKK